MSEQTFDVFLAHNSKDKPFIRQVYQKLEEQGIKPWLDEEEIAPGDLFLKKIQEAISRSRTAAVFIGLEGLGQWQAFEATNFISLFIQQSMRVIPVLLPGVESIPDDFFLLKQFQYVQFETSLEDPTALYLLEWGITGVKPKLDIEIPIVGPSKSGGDSPSPSLIQKCNPAKILFIKNVKDPSGRWAYLLEGVLPSAVPTFELMWRLSSHGVGLPKAGDLMLLHQQAKVTHLVEFLDDEIRKTDWGYLRWVKVVWMPKHKDWHLLPHQQEVLGFDPKYRDGNTHSFTSPNFTRFKQSWGNLRDFQLNLLEHLIELS